MRSEWQLGGGAPVFRDDWPADPWVVVAEWLPDNDDPARPLMTVSTVDASGAPDGRIQLLTSWSTAGFAFHTDSRSRKVAQLAADPRVALTMHLPADARQITVQGVAEPTDDAERARSYANRSPYLQQLAWQNTVEFASLPGLDRVSAWEGFAADHPEGLTAPPTWAGYRVVPSRLTFWVGSTHTASRRTEYTRSVDATADAEAGSGWTVATLAG